MKPQRLSLAVAALLAAGGVWFAVSSLRSTAPRRSTPTPRIGAHPGPDGAPPQPGEPPRPPNPTRRFMDFTPEQRVDFARKGSGPGG